MAEADLPDKNKPNPIKNFKRLFLVLVLLALGGLLALAGFGLIQFSPNLTKYSGIGLLILAVVYYLIY